MFPLSSTVGPNRPRSKRRRSALLAAVPSHLQRIPVGVHRQSDPGNAGSARCPWSGDCWRGHAVRRSGRRRQTVERRPTPSKSATTSCCSTVEAHVRRSAAHVEFFRYNMVGSGRGWPMGVLESRFARGGPVFVSRLARISAARRSPVAGSEPSVYANDEWRVSDRLSLTLGLRSRRSLLHRHPRVQCGRRCDLPSPNQRLSALSARNGRRGSGSRWQPDRDDRTIVRGGAGVFVGRPPLGWLVGPMHSDGSGSPRR